MSRIACTAQARIKKLLEGATYVMNEKGFAPHPNLTRWLARGIEQAITAMNGRH